MGKYDDLIDHLEYGGSNTLYAGNPDLTFGKDFREVTLDSLGVTISVIKEELLGMNEDLVDPTTNEPYSDQFFQDMLELAVSETEKKFDFVIRPRLVMDRLDYHRNDFTANMFINSNARPILHVEQAKLYYNEQSVMDMPDSWIKVTNRMGQLQVQPSTLFQGLNQVINPLIYPMGGIPYMGNPSPFNETEYAPQMIGVAYIAGMMPQPEDEVGINRDWYIQPDVIRYIGKLGAIEVLERFGRTILGPGIASYSVGFDGMSSSVDSTQSAENSATAGEIRNLKEDMKDIEAGIRNFYGAYNIGLIG